MNEEVEGHETRNDVGSGTRINGPHIPPCLLHMGRSINLSVAVLSGLFPADVLLTPCTGVAASQLEPSVCSVGNCRRWMKNQYHGLSCEMSYYHRILIKVIIIMYTAKYRPA